MWLWRRLLRIPWTKRRSNQPILKEIISEYSLEGLMMKLKLQFFGHLMWRTDSLEKTLMLGKIEGRKRSRRQKMRWLDGSLTLWTYKLDGSLTLWTYIDSMDLEMDMEAWCSAVHRVAKSRTRLRDLNELMITPLYPGQFDSSVP